MKSIGYYIACILIGSVPVFAEMTGNQILSDCKELPTKKTEAVEMMKFMRCMAHLTGFLEALSLTVGPSPAGKTLFGATPQFCPPAAGIENNQVRLIVLRALEAEPEYLHQSARFTIMKALLKSFPC